MNSRGRFSSVNLFLKDSSMQHNVAQHFKTRRQGYQQCAVYHSKKILQAQLDKFPLFQEKKDNQKMNKLRHLNNGGLKDVMHSV